MKPLDVGLILSAFAIGVIIGRVMETGDHVKAAEELEACQAQEKKATHLAWQAFELAGACQARIQQAEEGEVK